MNGDRRNPYGTPQGTGFYSPYSKHPTWGRGFGRMFSNLGAGLGQFQQMQEQKKQQQFKQDIIEREIKLKEEQAQVQPKPTRWDFEQQYSKYMVDTEQWSPDQGNTFLAKGTVPPIPVGVDSETKKGIEELFGLEDFDKEPPKDQVGYVRTFALQQGKAEPGKPLERESLKLKQDRDKLVSPLVERYEGIAKKIDAAIYGLGEDRENEKYPLYQRQLHNAKKVLDIARYAQSIVDGGDELSDGLRKLIQQLAYKTREVQTGAFFKTDKFLESSKFFEPDEFGYVVGEVRRNAAGEERIYGGNNKWVRKQ